MEYEKKYLKYKNKYFKLKGGLINNININDLSKQKENYMIPSKLKSYIDLITIENTNVIRVGSSSFKIQPFFSDVDIMNIIYKDILTNELVRFFIDSLKKNILKITTNSNIFFSDFKAGNMHWTVDEIMDEIKEGKTLTECCMIKGIIKLDMIAPYNERYVEMSTYFILQSNEGFINIESNYFDSLEKTLKDDIDFYKNINPFKAIKRLWSLAKIKDDVNLMKKLQDIIKSNLSLLSQIIADIETLKLLINNNHKYNKKFTINQIEKFKENISSILDIQIDEKYIYIIIDFLIVLFNTNNTETYNNKQKIIEYLNHLHTYLSKIINKETFDYINSVGFNFPSKDKSIIENILSLFN